MTERMRIRITVPASLGEAFLPGTFEGNVTKEIIVSMPTGTSMGQVVAVETSADGREATLTIEVPDEVEAS